MLESTPIPIRSDLSKRSLYLDHNDYYQLISKLNISDINPGVSIFRPNKQYPLDCIALVNQTYFTNGLGIDLSQCIDLEVLYRILKYFKNDNSSTEAMLHILKTVAKEGIEQRTLPTYLEFRHRSLYQDQLTNPYAIEELNFLSSVATSFETSRLVKPKIL